MISYDARSTIYQKDIILVYIRHLVLYSAFIVNTSAVGTSAFFAMSFDIVITKLTDLVYQSISANLLMRGRTGGER